MFRYKTEVMTIKEFMRLKVENIPALEKGKFPTSGSIKLSVITDKPTRKQLTKLTVIMGATLLSLGFGDPTFAAAGAVNAAITNRVVTAFDPLIALVQALSYPIGLTVMLCGGIFLMLGNADRGLTMIQRAGAGYIAVQLLPLLMDLLVEIAKAL